MVDQQQLPKWARNYGHFGILMNRAGIESDRVEGRFYVWVKQGKDYFIGSTEKAVLIANKIELGHEDGYSLKQAVEDEISDLIIEEGKLAEKLELVKEKIAAKKRLLNKE